MKENRLNGNAVKIVSVCVHDCCCYIYTLSFLFSEKKLDSFSDCYSGCPYRLLKSLMLDEVYFPKLILIEFVCAGGIYLLTIATLFRFYMHFSLAINGEKGSVLF